MINSKITKPIMIKNQSNRKRMNTLNSKNKNKDK